MDRHWHDRAAVVARWAGLAVVLAGAVLVLWMTRFFTEWPETYVGSGPSMEPTVKPGEYFTVRSPVGELRPGMLVIFRFVHEDGTVFHVLRRLAALPGDTIAMREGRAILNGRPTDWPFRVLEPRASRSQLARTPDLYTWGPWVVPRDSVVLLSDTRDIVGWPDSRFLGFIPGTALESEAGRMLWAPTRGGMFLRRLR
ncbi:MAG: signal peptidase I [Gemmatimonadales bacterium]|nr:signal peptidase I [Gemmatimonadales bacterium]